MLCCSPAMAEVASSSAFLTWRSSIADSNMNIWVSMLKTAALIVSTMRSSRFLCARHFRASFFLSSCRCDLALSRRVGICFPSISSRRSSWIEITRFSFSIDAFSFWLLGVCSCSAMAVSALTFAELLIGIFFVGGFSIVSLTDFLVDSFNMGDGIVGIDDFAASIVDLILLFSLLFFEVIDLVESESTMSNLTVFGFSDIGLAFSFFSIASGSILASSLSVEEAAVRFFFSPFDDFLSDFLFMLSSSVIIDGFADTETWIVVVGASGIAGVSFMTSTTSYCSSVCAGRSSCSSFSLGFDFFFETPIAFTLTTFGDLVFVFVSTTSAFGGACSTADDIWACMACNFAIALFSMSTFLATSSFAFAAFSFAFCSFFAFCFRLISSSLIARCSARNWARSSSNALRILCSRWSSSSCWSFRRSSSSFLRFSSCCFASISAFIFINSSASIRCLITSIMLKTSPTWEVNRFRALLLLSRFHSGCWGKLEIHRFAYRSPKTYASSNLLPSTASWKCSMSRSAISMYFVSGHDPNTRSLLEASASFKALRLSALGESSVTDMVKMILC